MTMMIMMIIITFCALDILILEFLPCKWQLVWNMLIKIIVIIYLYLIFIVYIFILFLLYFILFYFILFFMLSCIRHFRHSFQFSKHVLRHPPIYNIVISFI